MYFDEILEDLKNKKKRREQGLFNGIPTHFKRYSQYFPSLDKGSYIGLLAATGMGKSKFMRDFAIYRPFEFSLRTGYPIKILYFALEDPKNLVYKHMLRHYLWERQNLLLPNKYLESKDEPLSDKHLEIIESDRDFYVKLEKNVFIVTDSSSPNEIKEMCYKFHEKYAADNHLIVVIDNYSNITKDAEDKNEWEAVRRLSRNIIRLDLCRKKEITVFGVLQQDFESEKAAFRGAGGKATVASLEPNMGGIGDAKVVAKDFFELFAIFNPWRYEIREYMGTSNDDAYDISILRNSFRSLIHLKSNNGEVAPRLGMYFDGLKETYEEMPLVTDREALQKIYNAILQKEKEKREKTLGNERLF